MHDGNLDDFFAHVILSQMRIMRLGKTSDLVGCLEDMLPPQENVTSPQVEVIILDGAAITNLLVGTWLSEDLL